jgi:HSP20 family protein
MLSQHRLRRVFEPSFMRPSRLLSELQHDFSDLFQAIAVAPDVRTWAADDQVVMEIDAPGIQSADVDISVENDELSVAVPAPAAEETAGRNYFLRERRSGGRRQQFRLPFPADAAKTDAVYDNGVLRITVHRREDSKPARVAVRAG